MSAPEVNFEPGCIFLPGVIMCGSGGVVIREHGKCYGLCAKPGARLVVREPNSPWYGPDFSCECGDSWEYEERSPRRPFERAWRPKAVEAFEKAWADALPEGTEIIRDNSEDGGGYLSGVRLPDGTVVTR